VLPDGALDPALGIVETTTPAGTLELTCPAT
jgi:hypothetical protein